MASAVLEHPKPVPIPRELAVILVRHKLAARFARPEHFVFSTRTGGRFTSRGHRSFVVGERFGLELAALFAILEHMGDPNCGWDPLDPALHQFQAGVIAQIEVVQPLGFGPTDVTGGGIALRVNVCVVPDEGLPVLITRPFD
ncbi:MAG: hypothetical protein ACRDPM_00525 [Solirubrobacteraceae bacterium]